MKAIFFDLDGTLTDPREGITRCLAHALERLSLRPPPLAEMTWAIGPPLRASLARLIGTDERDADFTDIYGCELDGMREDKRELLADLMREHDLDPRETVMIGDRGVDMRAARHHQVAALGALWGYGNEAELQEHGADALFDAPANLPSAIGALSKRSVERGAQ